MQALAILVLSFTPGIFWLWLIYRWDRYQPEPRSLVIRTFLWGVVSAIPIALIEFFLAGGTLDIASLGQVSLTRMAYHAFVVAGFTEELGKLLVVRLAVYRSPYFDESTDGIIYAAAAALGFASLENLSYVLAFGWQVILARGLISTLGHVLFSVIWGYPLALLKIKWPRSAIYFWLGLGGAMVAHGFFDFFLFTQTWYALLVLPLFIGLMVAVNMMLRHSRRISTFRGRVAEFNLTCPGCGGRAPVYSSYCPACGAGLTAVKKAGTLSCGNCGAILDRTARYCTSCGSRVVQKPGAPSG